MQNFNLLQKDIDKHLIKHGLDLTIEESLDELKSALKSFINDDVRSAPPAKDQNAPKTDIDNTALPKTDQDLIKYITGLDVDKIRKTGDYTTSIDSDAVVSNNSRVRMRFPISDTESFEENQLRANNFFNKAIFIFADGSGSVSYFLNPGIDMSQYIKIVCSRDTGDTDRSRAKFDRYKNSDRMPRQNSSDLGRYAEWTLTQEGVNKIKDVNSGFVNLTSIISDIKSGNFQEALVTLQQSKVGARYAEIKEKIENIQQQKDLTPDIATYVNIISLINNLKVANVNKNANVTIYDLDSSFSDDSKDKSVKFFDEVYNQINVWILANSLKWAADFVSLASDILKKY